MKWVLVPLVETDEMISAAAKVKHPWDVWDAMLAVAPKREWVGLTDDERNLIGRSHAYVSNIISAVEAKLKEKNSA